MPLYYAVVGNRDHIKLAGEKRPFWEFLDRPPNGFLSSLAYLPLRDFALPNAPKLGDCGAWSYKHETTPRLGKHFVTPEWAIAQYQRYFATGDLLVAPDHMLIPFENINLDDRRSFNLNSARIFLPLAQAAGFRPMATVHGMTIAERLTHIEQLHDLGYQHFALGGLAARAGQKRQCIETVHTLSQKIRSLLPTAWIHVLGLSSPDYACAWAEIGVTSFDGSSHFKQAFIAGTFFQVEGDRLLKHQASRPGELTTAPICNCRACTKLRSVGIDTRSYGSNENNMGRAAHNLNMLMQAHQAAMPSYDAPASCSG